MALHPIQQARVDLTVSCRDCDPIPKIEGAGRIIGDRQIMHNGVEVAAGGYHGEWMSEIISTLQGHHEPQEELIFHEVLTHIGPSATMIELGGFWSYYSLWFLRNEAQRHAIVLEPDPAHIEVGKKNAELNAAKNLDFIQGSVGAASLPARPFPTETSGVVSIPEFSVPDILRKAGMDTLDILHCDAQGAETEVIKSCEELLRSGSIKFAVFSTHAFQISGDPLTHQKCLGMMEDFGGRILAEHDVHESFSGDGLIAAYFGKDAVEWQPPRLSYNRYSKSVFRNPLYDLAELMEAKKPEPEVVKPSLVRRILSPILG